MSQTVKGHLCAALIVASNAVLFYHVGVLRTEIRLKEKMMEYEGQARIRLVDNYMLLQELKDCFNQGPVTEGLCLLALQFKYEDK